ncbi:MAG TPA: glycosyltransferase family 1 protein [bacterium]|nr:glycosyltransferase family 1 protein [bacterium]
MNILMVAPEPIFEPRGTPLSVVGRLKALSDMGHHVDLLTYPMGRSIDLHSVHIHRTPRIPGIRKIKIGPSLAKVPLDLCLMLKTFHFLWSRYDVLHTHEEAGFWGTLFAGWFRVPHIYDMHSSLPQQLENFEFSRSRLLKRIFECLERWVLNRAGCVITICPDLAEHVQKVIPEKGSVLIENAIDYAEVFGEEDLSEQIRTRYQLDGHRVALYAGTFEPYQGLGLLLKAVAISAAQLQDVKWILVGGRPDQVENARILAAELGIDSRCIFTGQVEPGEVNSYMRCAHCLLSPRTTGTNTPLKIYSYLRSGVPIVATRLWTHTQVLNDQTAFLADPTEEDFARAMIDALSKEDQAHRRAVHARALAHQRYSYDHYKEKLTAALRKATGTGG